MHDYFVLKILHITAALLLFGTGMGITYYLNAANKTNDPDIIRLMSINAIWADLIFTMPAYIILLITAYFLWGLFSISAYSLWFVMVVTLLIIFSSLWLVIISIQWRIKPLIKKDKAEDPIHKDVPLLLARRVKLSIPAYSSLLLIFTLMIMKPWLNQCVLSCGSQ